MEDFKFDYKEIINFLKKDGIGSKKILVKKLENATIENLINLRRSLTEIINEKSMFMNE